MLRAVLLASEGAVSSATRWRMTVPVATTKADNSASDAAMSWSAIGPRNLSDGNTSWRKSNECLFPGAMVKTLVYGRNQLQHLHLILVSQGSAFQNKEGLSLTAADQWHHIYFGQKSWF